MTDKVQKSPKDSAGAKAQKPKEPIGLDESLETPAINKQRFDWRSLNTLAVVSIATAISSIGAVAAIITGHISLAQIKRSGENGRKIALTGVTIGYVTIGLWIIFGILAVSLRAFVEPGSFGSQPFEQDLFEFRKGFGGKHGHDN